MLIMTVVTSKHATKAGMPVTVAPSSKSFYSFYLNEHQNITCSRLHFAGSSLSLLGVPVSLNSRKPSYAIKGVIAGYACTLVGHYFFERNKPATFKYPLQSFVSNFRVYKSILTRNLNLIDKKLDKTG